MSRTQTTERSSDSDLSWIQWWNRTRHQLYAPIYDLVARPLERGRERAVDQLDLQPGDRVLILGAGTGSDLKYLPDDVQVTAVDAAPAMVRRTRERAEMLGREVDVRLGDAQALSFGDNTFDAVLLHLILSVVPGPQAVAKESARVLAPDGQVSIYDKFVPEDEDPSLVRRALNPVARFLFSDLTRELDPLLAHADLEGAGIRESALGGLYTIALAEAIGESSPSGTSMPSSASTPKST
jgi:ubiquinone/menaquinone biosynthesis C-methylase UbiE